MEEPAYRIDIEGLNDSATPSNGNRAGPSRPWVGIHFDCCAVYTRVYRNAEGTAYFGNCPKCGKRVRMRVGENGISARFFVAE